MLWVGPSLFINMCEPLLNNTLLRNPNFVVVRVYLFFNGFNFHG